MIVGVDPGASGAVALLEGSNLVQVFDMPTVEEVINGKKRNRVAPWILVEELAGYRDQIDVAFVERVGAMPGQGVSSMFAFGEALGIIRGVFAGMYVPCHLVPPAKWKRDLKVPAGKDGSRSMAAQLWPRLAGEFKRVRDDGRAEAALIGYWGVKQ